MSKRKPYFLHSTTIFNRKTNKPSIFQKRWISSPSGRQIHRHAWHIGEISLQFCFCSRPQSPSFLCHVVFKSGRLWSCWWPSCFLTRRSFPHRSPWLRSAFNGDSFSRKVSEQNVNNPQKSQPLARLQEANAFRWIFRTDLSKVS